MIMKNNTLEDYKKAIKAKYDEIINHNPDGFLNNPSPGNLKSKCLFLLDDITSDDRKNYRLFFELKENIDTRKQIEDFDINRFRTLQSFLLGKVGKPSEKKLEILAILVELENRPFKKFRESRKIEFEGITAIETDKEKTDTAPITTAINIEENKEEEKAEEIIEDELPKVENENENENEKEEEEEEINPDNSNSMPTAITHNFYSGNSEQSIHKGKRQYKLTAKHIKIAAVIIGVFMVGYILKNIFTDHECMTWKADHYESVPCNTDVKSFMRSSIIRLNEETLKYQKRVTPCDTTTFFLPNGTPCVWYCRMPDGTIEYFSYPGLHPVSGETLKKITQHIVEKYVMVKGVK